MLHILRLGACALVLAAGLSAASGDTALDRYVAAPDPAFKYDLVQTVEGPGYTAWVLDMASQTWRSASEVDRPVWRHWVTIVRPEGARGNTGLLYITGGNNNDRKPPVKPEAMLTAIALASKTVVAEVRMVPNQPLTFAGEKKGRVEDEMIAYTWDKYLRGGDDNWPARLPMTKAAVRAMDAVTGFCKSKGTAIERYVVAGGSKRGWTTWTTAAVDKRVVAIAPLVIDLLNIQPSFEHHYRVYGFWAPAVKDYQEMGIMDRSRSKRYRELMKIEEPYEYRDRLTIPKFLINAAGDQFFLPDSSQFYWKDLKGEKYIRYVPNTDHSLRKSDAVESLIAWYTAFINGEPRPRFDWELRKDGVIRVRTGDVKPTTVKLWQATNPNGRDFRLETIGPVWRESTLQPSGDGVFEGRATDPPKGYTAYFIEATFASDRKPPMKFTSGVRVTPDTYPHPPFQPKPAPTTEQRSSPVHSDGRQPR
ncbi:MAG TPA: PhoPQ-activated pathogenicity-related family protein [Bryobacteraceae bacterium]|nr:PhoPQ-activated pathogenicity-related family protein [Bryobacteraceae bacterium]